LLINNFIFEIIFICVYESPSLTNDINKVSSYILSLVLFII